MGEYADYMLNVNDCQECGEYLGEGDGFPRSCAACGGDDDDSEDDIPVKATPKNKYKTKEQWAQSITDKTLAGIKMHGNPGWRKEHHKIFADKIRAVVEEGLKFNPSAKTKKDKAA